MNKRNFQLLTVFVLSILICGAVGLFVGMTVAGNGYTEFVYRGLVGWEGGGLLGLHLGILSGLAIGIYIWKTRLKNSAKNLTILLIIIILLGIGIAIPALFLKENPKLTLMAWVCSTDEDPRIVASMHFDHPLQRLLTLTTIVSGEDGDDAIYVSGYTLFGIEFTKARVACADDPFGRVMTVKSFFFTDNSGDVSYRKSVSYNIVTNSPTYREYEFDGSINPDSGSRDVLLAIEKDGIALHGNAKMTSGDQEMEYIEITRDDKEKGVLEKHAAGTDIYDVQGDDLGNSYSLYKNGELLFRSDMDYGADGPVLDWRIVAGKPAFTIRLGCTYERAVEACVNDVFYDGEFMTKKYRVEDPRYLFEYDGKVGFIAKDQGKDRIFFNSEFITPAFDEIHMHNCCSIIQILPTVYENGVLLFYGTRAEKNYLVEVKLQD